jgi:hypothetical protein
MARVFEWRRASAERLGESSAAPDPAAPHLRESQETTMPSALASIVALASVTLQVAAALVIVLTATTMAGAGSGGPRSRRRVVATRETPVERYSRRDVRVEDG